MISAETLLGRQQFQLLPDPALLAGATVLITGGAGSIGRALCTAARSCAVARVILLDHDDTALAEAERTLGRAEEAIPLIPLLGDVCDRAQLERIVARFRPDLVVHAAAYKIVPLVERNAASAAIANVIATDILCEVVGKAGVARCVFVSSYEAFEPKNVFGFTKRAAERAVVYQTRRWPKTDYRGIRFSLVLFSRGSVANVFVARATAGLPLPITHPDANRYLCSLEEAACSTLSAISTGRSGDVLTLDMGEPVLVLELARAIIAQCRSSSDIEIVGTRPGEKVAESRLGGEGGLLHTDIPGLLVSRDAPWPADRYERFRRNLSVAIASGNDDRVAETLQEVAGG